MSTSHTEIAWTDRTWNPVRGCSIVSEGCHRCYAMKLAHRFSGPGKPYESLTKLTARSGPQWTGVVRTVESALLEPLAWRKPQRVFVNSMSDLFHEDVPDAFIDQVFAVMALAPRHTFQILTKRAERMRAYFAVDVDVLLERWAAATMEQELPLSQIARDNIREGADRDEQVAFSAEIHWSDVRNGPWPLPNVWLGVSVENQQYADDRIPLLLQTPAAVRFISAEPLLGPVDVAQWLGGPGTAAGRETRGPLTQQGAATTGEDASLAIGNVAKPQFDPSGAVASSARPSISWVIVGGESGPGARPFDLAWARSIVQQCQAAGVPVFVKQLGAVPMMSHVEWEGTGDRVLLLNARNARRVPDGFEPIKLHDKKGGVLEQWPEALRVRQFPEARA